MKKRRKAKLNATLRRALRLTDCPKQPRRCCSSVMTRSSLATESNSMKTLQRSSAVSTVLHLQISRACFLKRRQAKLASVSGTGSHVRRHSPRHFFFLARVTKSRRCDSARLGLSRHGFLVEPWEGGAGAARAGRRLHGRDDGVLGASAVGTEGLLEIFQAQPFDDTGSNRVA